MFRRSHILLRNGLRIGCLRCTHPLVIQEDLDLVWCSINGLPTNFHMLAHEVRQCGVPIDAVSVGNAILGDYPVGRFFQQQIYVSWLSWFCITMLLPVREWGVLRFTMHFLVILVNKAPKRSSNCERVSLA